MRIVGIDSSLNGTGLAAYEDSTFQASRMIATKKIGHERLATIEDRVCDFLRKDPETGDEVMADLVVIEGLAFGGYDSNRQLAGLWWILVHRCWEYDIPVLSFNPTSRQKWLTGSGKANKRLAYETVNGPAFPGARVMSHDEADAVSLVALGQRHLELEPVDRVPEERWPAVRDTAWWPVKREEIRA